MDNAARFLCQRPSRCSTFLRLLPTFLTAFFTAVRELRVFLASEVLAGAVQASQRRADRPDEATA